MNHPNTTAAGLTGLAGTGVVYALNHWAGTSLSATDGALAASALAAAVLFVGRRGIKGTLQAVWIGNQKQPPAE